MPNNISFYIFAVGVLATATAAMRLRNPVHCALAAAAAFAGLAVIYFQLDAEFISFAQLLIYVGAISILVIFAVLLTRGSDIQPGVELASPHWLTGLAIAVLVAFVIAVPVCSSSFGEKIAPKMTVAPVKLIGEELMTRYLFPLETMGLLLTVALIGAAVIALREPEESEIRNPKSEIRKQPTTEELVAEVQP